VSYIEPGSLPAPDWRDVAACRQPGLSPEVFFVDRRGHSPEDPWATARDVCAWCPSVEPCLIYALDNDLRDGMFGGLTPDERSAVKARQR
jgi:WhiB family redox-sensing transcriptional regulator